MTSRQSEHPERRRGVPILAIVLMLAGVVVGCAGSDGSASGVCSAPEHIVDSSGGGHALPGADVVYDTYPPASGRHLDARFAPQPGAYTTPLSPVEQVTALHQGMAVVVYDPDQVDDEGFEQLTSLTSGGDLVVVPADQALPERAAIAITWWETRQLCSDIDESVIENATKEAAASASRH